MNYILVTFPVAVLCFFLGFYANLLIKILVDLLNGLMGLKNRQETIAQQEQLNQSHATFVEPQSLVEIQAQQQIDKIKALNDNQDLPDL